MNNSIANLVDEIKAAFNVPEDADYAIEATAGTNALSSPVPDQEPSEKTAGKDGKPKPTEEETGELKRFYVHKFLLKARCPCFLAVVKNIAETQGQTEENGVKVVRMNDFKAGVVEAFLKHIYTLEETVDYGEFELVKELMCMAHQYQAQFILEYTADKLFKLVSKANVFQLAECAFLLDIKKLQTDVIDWLLSSPNGPVSRKRRMSKSIFTANPEEWESLKTRNPVVGNQVLEAYIERVSEQCDECSSAVEAYSCKQHKQPTVPKCTTPGCTQPSTYACCTNHFPPCPVGGCTRQLLRTCSVHHRGY